MIAATIAGNLGGDAEVKTSPNGKTVVNFSVACSRYDASAPNNQATTWVRVSMWGDRGTKLAQYLTKGTSIVCRGELSTREYQKDGATRTAVELRADDVKLMGGKPQESKTSARQAGDPDWLHG